METTRGRAYGDGINGAVAAVLRSERAAVGLTIEQLAQRSGIPTVTVQRLLAARRPITMETFGQLCAALGLTPVEAMSHATGRLERYMASQSGKAGQSGSGVG